MGDGAAPPLRDDHTSLKEAVLEELRTQRHLKREVLQELGTERRGWADLFKHPAILLLIGAISSGFLGQYLTTQWQSREWTRQQAQIQQQKETDIRHALINDLAVALAETISACHDVLALATWQWSPDRQAAESGNRLDYWLETSRKWRINARVLEQKLRIYYSAGAVDAFNEIVEERRQVGNDITNLVTATRIGEIRPRTPEGVDEQAPEGVDKRALLERVNKLDDHLSGLTAIMMHEAKQPMRLDPPTDQVAEARASVPAARKE